jgi:hypothetical protein
MVAITAGFVSSYVTDRQSFLWANRPDATLYPPGYLISISDVGVAGSAIFMSNGTIWVPANPVVIGRSGVAVPNSSSTNSAEFNLAAVAIPAGLLGLNGSLDIDLLYTFTGSTNSKSINVRHNTTSAALSGGTLLVTSATTTAGDVAYRTKTELHARNSQASQAARAAAHLVGGFSSGALLAPTIDTSAASYINFNGIKALGSETMTLEWYEVTLRP